LDRARARLGLLILAAALTAAAPRALPIRSAQWLAPEMRLEALVRQPAECARRPEPGPERDLFLIGRAAFRTPMLLGGQAARAGLKCESCHTNGRRNAAFLFPGLSAAPGTADVTASLMSSHRGNGQFDPRPIPDLAYPVKISRDPKSRALEQFIRGLIVEEFDGAEPPPLILDGLGAYVRAIDARYCPAGSSAPLGLSTAIATLREGAMAAATALDRGDGASARLLLSGVRAMLGDINERFAGVGLARQREQLRLEDQTLLGIQHEIDGGAIAEAARDLTLWRARIPDWSEGLASADPRSLYNRRRLAKALR